MSSLELHTIDDAGGPGWDDLLSGRFCTFSEDHPGGSAPIEDMFALPGADGQRAIELLRRAKDEGEAELLALAGQAIRRLAADPDWITTTTLFSDEELERLQNAFSATVAAADLLGRSRIIAIANREREGVQTFSDGEYNGFEMFADPIPPQPPRSAVEYFRSLIPSLNIDPSRYGPGLMRQAFTLAYATDQTLLQRVKGVILNYLRGRRDRIAPIAGMRANDVVPTGTEAIQKLLDDAGVSPRSPQYAELVLRTNTLDAYNAGSWAEISHPDNGDVFPVWQYLGIRDGRQGEDHEPQFERYYEVRFPFMKVRGPRVWNCRCAPRALTRRQWERLQANGAVLSQPPQW